LFGWAEAAEAGKDEFASPAAAAPLSSFFRGALYSYSPEGGPLTPRHSIMRGIRMVMLLFMYFGYSWKSSITVRGHSVSTLNEEVERKDGGLNSAAAV
jgi:hypothetical protein